MMFISLIPYLESNEGHLFLYHETLSHAIPLSVDHMAYIPTQAKLERVPKNWIRAFHKVSKRRLFKFFTLCYDFCKILKTKSLQKRIFFFDSFSTLDLLSLLIASKLFLKKGDQFWLLARSECTRKSYSFALRHLRCTLFTDSESMQPFLEKISQKKSHLLPVLAVVPKSEISREKKQKPLLLWAGEPRKEKGLKEIVHLMQSLDNNLYDVMLTHHPELEKFSKTCQLIERGLPPKQFYNYLASADVVLLPYDKSAYRITTSGIFVESVIYGKIPLVKEGTWLATELKKFDLHELIVTWGSPTFFSHLERALHNAEVRKKLARMQKAYREMHSLNGFNSIFEPLLKSLF